MAVRFSADQEAQYVGAVIALREANGYHDSDFFALVWDADKGEAFEVEYGSTRGAYTGGASVDATPEVLAAYNNKVAADRRRARIIKARENSKLRAEIAREFGVRLSVIRKLERAYGAVDATPVHVPSYRERTYGKQSYDDGRALAYGFRRYATKFDKVIGVARQAKGGKLRNAFRKSLGERVLAWLADPAPAYDTPLSLKQVNYL